MPSIVLKRRLPSQAESYVCHNVIRSYRLRRLVNPTSQAFEELRQFERYRRMQVGVASLAERRQRFVAGTVVLQALLLGG